MQKKFNILVKQSHFSQLIQYNIKSQKCSACKARGHDAKHIFYWSQKAKQKSQLLSYSLIYINWTFELSSEKTIPQTHDQDYLPNENHGNLRIFFNLQNYWRWSVCGSHQFWQLLTWTRKNKKSIQTYDYFAPTQSE